MECIDMIDGASFHSNVPIMIIREATAEEWVNQRVLNGGSEQAARQALKIRLGQFPDAKFYDVSVD